MRKLLDKKIGKVIFIQINPIIIGVCLPLLFSIERYKWIVVIIGVILLILYAYTMWVYETMQKDDKNEIQKLENEIQELEQKNSNKDKKIERLEHTINVYDKELREISTLCFDSLTGINTLSKEFLKGNIKLDIWNFRRASTGICKSIYDILSTLYFPYDEFSVNIMLCDVTATGAKQNITMIAYAGKYQEKPRRFEEKLYFDTNSMFYAVKLCKSKDTTMKILTTKEEINEKFVFMDDDHPEYSQYVGIPIVCSGNKIISLLQIASFKDSKIGETKADITDIVRKLIVPLTQYALLAYKIEKGFISIASYKEKREGKNVKENNTK